MLDMTQKRFTDPEAARMYLEEIRWPTGPVCPHCGGCDRIMTLNGEATRPGLYKCGDCREQFTVTVKTVFEKSKIPLHKWVMATTLLCSSKKGVSAHQLHRLLGITYKSAWFMCHRIREAMREGGGLMGGSGSTVEIDETFIGRKTRRLGEPKLQGGYEKKQKVLTLVERNGRARSIHVPAVNTRTLKPIIKKQVDAASDIMTDTASWYVNNKSGKSVMGKHFNTHESVNHGIREYVRGDIHTNTIEGYFSVLKRGLNGVYQHWSEEHLKRYLCEFDFRYNYREKLGYDDEDRTRQALSGISGKRLTYNPIGAQQETRIKTAP